MAQTAKTLVVFDFDLTLVNENSDTLFTQILEPELLPSYMGYVVNEGLSWIETVNRVLEQLWLRGHQADAIKRALSSMPITAAMRQLLDFLTARSDQFTIIIISDSNELFIRWILEALHIPLANFAAVYTNHATISPDGLIKISGLYDDVHPHSCTRPDPKCPARLCKTKALTDFLHTRPLGTFSRTIYLGDGKGDACPCLSLLGAPDVVLARNGYGLAKTLTPRRAAGDCVFQLHGWDPDNVFEVFATAIAAEVTTASL
jgi:pyridoxal phosphate phosphatase PHOSPHO2